MEVLQFIRGDSQSIEIQFLENDLPFNIMGMTVFFTVKEERFLDDLGDTNAVIQKIITTHSDPLQGKTILALTPLETTIDLKSYVRDLQLVSGALVKSTNYGSLSIQKDVTRTV